MAGNKAAVMGAIWGGIILISSLMEMSQLV
jgi:hypothetical protein